MIPKRDVFVDESEGIYNVGGETPRFGIKRIRTEVSTCS